MMGSLKLSICSFLFVILLDILVESSVIVTTTGPVLGKLVKDDNFRPYYAYLGIPYAENPGGQLRFKPPVRKQPWTEVLDATKAGPVCPQSVGKYTRDQMSEDCLKLNILVPATSDKTSLRPIIFYIHGGSFKSNTGNVDEYGPQFLLQKDVIYVSVNYRLGALGFLSFETEEAPGNAGIKDVIMALQWVKDNIERFGGSTITIGGQSSGSAIVHYLLLTKRTTGLFQRALLKSGSATNPRFFSQYPKGNAVALAKQLGFETDNIDSLLKNITDVSFFDIVEAQESIYEKNRSIMKPFAPFVPCIEKESSHAVLTKHPREIIRSGIPQNVPLLLGINSREGIFMWPSLSKKPVQDLKENYTLCIPYDIEYPIDSKSYKILVNSLSNLYFGGPDLSNWTLTNFYDLLSDSQYTSTVDLWIRVHAQKRKSQPIYYYEFDFEGDLNWAKINYNITFPGTAHADDLGYFFILDETREEILNMDSKTKRALDNTLTFITNFIKVGNPSPEGNGGEVTWVKSDKERHHLLLNDNPQMKYQPPFKDRFDFWNKVYIEYEIYLNNGGAREPRIPPNFVV